MATIAKVLPRPMSYTGLWSWLTTVDHKRVGILYGVTAFAFFLIGGIEAFLMRLQLAVPNNTLVDADTFNVLFTMHGTTMIFLAIMPLNAAFFNFIVPLQIGARDVAFPRLNALSYWVFLFGAILLNAGFFIGDSPDTGWFSYANLTSKAYSPGHGVDFWLLGLTVLGVSSIAAALNFFITIVNLRAPGMTLMRMPLFTWMTLVTSILLVLAMPIIAVALIFLMFDRFFGTNFYNPGLGADPVLWQHLFWVFGHPEVYILILPPMGIISDVLPVFSRKPLFGYAFVVYSGVAIGIMSFGVWSHHMFAVGLGPVADAVFTINTMLIAVPTGVKIFNWVATMWGGAIRFATPMLFAVAFIAMFIIGGLSGVMHASPPADLQQSDTYFIVAHLHYVLVSGSIFGIFAGIYYWFPKMTGRMLSEGLGKIHFWLFFIGMNLAFFPMHFLGLDGMPRRIYTYPPNMGWDLWNFVSTVGVVFIAVSTLVFIWNFFESLGSGEVSGDDPWDGATLEWSIPSPPPLYNFATIPTAHSERPFWDQKYGSAGHGRGAPAPIRGGAYAAAAGHESIHMPDPSYWPLFTAVGISLILAGLIFPIVRIGDLYPVTSIIGVLITFIGIYGWSFEPPAAGGVHGAPAAPEQVEETSTGQNHRKLLMWAFLGSDCMLFGALIGTYMIYRGRSLEGPFPGDVFDIPFTSLSAFVLLMSSFAMVLALAAIQRGDQKGLRVWLLATALLGTMFLGGQYYEFTTFYHEGLSLSSNLFGATFFTLTGFHGGHVTLGVIWLLSLVVLAFQGKVHQRDSLNVELAGLYWHFVDIVWIIIFTFVYLIPS